MAFDNELERAREYVLAGHYGGAIDLLADCETWPTPLDERALLLRVEIALRRDPVSALELLARVNDLFTTPEGRFGYYLTSGKAYSHSRNLDAAGDMFAAADAIASDSYPAGAEEVAYQRARLQWLRNEYDPNTADLKTAIASDDPGLRFEALAVRSWMHAGLGDYCAQLSDLVASIDVAGEHLHQCDARALGRTLHTLIRLALELGNVAASEAGERVFERMDWPEELREEQFLVIRALAWDAFLRGQAARAQWLLRDSKEVAPSNAWKVMAHVDRAFVARLSQNEAWATDELHEAHTLAREVAWAETHGEERQALPMLALLLASVDMAQAQHYVSTYIRLGFDSVDTANGITQDRRAEGYALHASGRVQQVLGNAATARKSLEAAYEIFVQSGYHFRAALVADSLGELTQDPQWVASARRHAETFPHSTLGEYFAPHAKLVGEAPGALSSLHRQLASALCDGLDITALSRRFSRSEFTIRREIKSLYDALDVGSVGELRNSLERRAV